MNPCSTACERLAGKANSTSRHPTASNKSAPLFFGPFTCLLTGQAFRTLSAVGCSSGVALNLAQPRCPILWFENSRRHAGMKLRHHRIGVRRYDGERPQFRPIRPSELFHPANAMG